MKRRRTKRIALGVSLFPFLSVLICTLGVLIILLVLAVRSADVRATKDQTAAQEKQRTQQLRRSEVSYDLDKRLVEIEGLESMRPDTLKRLAGAREHRGHLESDIRKLKKKAHRLAQALLDLEEPLGPSEVSLGQEDLDSRRVELEQKIRVAEIDLKKNRGELNANANAKMMYSIVPHAGNGGTFRRPMFIECTSDALVIQPLGIRLPKSEFAPPLEPGNMLDAALLAIREYWQKYDLQGTEGNPYPLLVVRPGGAETYVLARHAMSSWDDEFGYELVEAGKTLNFGARDEQLATEIQSVVDAARVRQRKIASARRRQKNVALQQAQSLERTRNGSSYRESNRRPGLTVSGVNGGFVVNSGWERENEVAGEHGRDDVDPLGGQPSLGNELADQSGLSPGPTRFGDREGDREGEDDQSGAGQNSFRVATHRTGANEGSRSIGAGQSTTGGEEGGNASAGASVASPYSDMSLAKDRGKNWALPTQTSGATGYVRPIRVVCSAGALEIRSAIGVEKRIVIDDNFHASVDVLIDEIWRQIESWGLPGERSYWKPELRISVVPGGELNFEKLRGSLLQSGVVVKEATQ